MLSINLSANNSLLEVKCLSLKLWLLYGENHEINRYYCTLDYQIAFILDQKNAMEEGQITISHHRELEIVLLAFNFLSEEVTRLTKKNLKAGI